MLRTEDRPTVARESKHIPASVNPSKLLAEITNCNSCLSWWGCWSRLGRGCGGGRATEQPPLLLSHVPEEMGHLGVVSGPVWMFLSIAGSANWFHARKCPKRKRNPASFFWSQGVSLPNPYFLCVQVKFASERTGFFHKIDCDSYIIWYEYLRNFSHEKSIL